MFNLKQNPLQFIPSGRGKKTHSRNSPCDGGTKVTRLLSYLLGVFSQTLSNLLIQLHSWTIFQQATMTGHCILSFPLSSAALILLPSVFSCLGSQPDTSWDFSLSNSLLLFQVRQLESFTLKTNHDEIMFLHSIVNMSSVMAATLFTLFSMFDQLYGSSHK